MCFPGRARISLALAFRMFRAVLFPPRRSAFSPAARRARKLRATPALPIFPLPASCRIVRRPSPPHSVIARAFDAVCVPVNRGTGPAACITAGTGA
jgi:hypothetical protein